MAKSIFAILIPTIFMSHITVADCETSSIPGYFENRYTDNIDGTVTDKMTNLMWMKCSVDAPWDATQGICEDNRSTTNQENVVSKYTWQEALLKTQEANIQRLTGYSDWRLPNIKELTSTLGLHCLDTQDLAFNKDYFLGTSSVYWSSTPHRNSAIVNNNPVNSAWKVSFRLGIELGARPTPIDQAHSVRLVRNNL